MRNVISLLKNIGCKVTSRESTPGAEKWWLTYPTRRHTTQGVLSARRAALDAVGINAALDGRYEFRGDGFILSFQTEEDDGHHGIFVAKPRKTKKGAEYFSGLDC